jgi:hypothetical protein
MQAAKIKTFVIFVLLLVNIAFILIIVADKVSSGNIEARSRSDLIDILSDKGIAMSESDIPRDRVLYTYRLTRDQSKESSIAEALLGKCEGEDQGGSIYYYTSANGWARFRGNGEFEAELFHDDETASLPDYCLNLLDKMDLSQSGYLLREDGAATVLSFTLLSGEHEIFNCHISFMFQGSRLVSVSGVRPMSEPVSRTSDNFISFYTAVSGFLSGIHAEGYVCNRIEEAQAGYLFSAALSGSDKLVPVWRITTDSGAYFIHGISGKMQEI